MRHALSRIVGAIKDAAAFVRTLKERIGNVLDRARRRDDTWDEERLIGVEAEVPVRGWTIAVLFGFDPFARAIDLRLRILIASIRAPRLHWYLPALSRTPAIRS